MKSQFTKIAKIRKQKRDVIERDLMKSQNKEKMLNHKIVALYDQIVELKTPQEGTVSLLSLLAEHKKILNRDKKNCEEDLEAARQHTALLRSDYQKAHIDYEKIHYLEEQELQALMEKMKKDEQLFLDEVSTQLFANHIQKR